ncbi:hypothetical protein IIA16_05800, partial [bacterium]|nr:hypothetical protein [bacterium]
MNSKGLMGSGVALLALVLAGGIGATALGAVEEAPGMPKIPELPEGFPFDIPRGEDREEKAGEPGGDQMFRDRPGEHRGCDLAITKSHGDG